MRNRREILPVSTTIMVIRVDVPFHTFVDADKRQAICDAYYTLDIAKVATGALVAETPIVPVVFKEPLRKT